MYNRIFSSTTHRMVNSTEAHTIWLSLGMERMDIHGEVELALDHLDTCPRELVGTVDAFGVPVSPVDKVLKQSDGKWMRQT